MILYNRESLSTVICQQFFLFHKVDRIVLKSFSVQWVKQFLFYNMTTIQEMENLYMQIITAIIICQCSFEISIVTFSEFSPSVDYCN